MRRLLIALLALPVLLVAAHVLLWRWVGGRLEDGYQQWVAQRRAAGWTVTAGTPARGGWPLAATLTVPDFFLSGGQPDIPGGMTWTADRLRLRVSLLALHRLAILPEGAQRLRWADAPDIPFAADRMEILVRLEPGVPAHAAEWEVQNLRAGVPGDFPAAPAPEAVPAPGSAPQPGAVRERQPAVSPLTSSPPAGPSPGLTIAGLRGHGEMHPAAPAGEAALQISLAATAIDLPADRTWALGPRMDSLDLEGALNGPLPRLPGLAARAAAWRDRGGAVEVQRLAMQWGRLGVNASATLALDQSLQPMGAATARLTGTAAALDAMEANGAINRRAAAAAKAVLALMVRPGGDGTPPETEVPLTLQDRLVSLGRIPLARMPELVWPAEP